VGKVKEKLSEFISGVPRDSHQVHFAKPKIQKVNILADDMGPLRGPLDRDCESAITEA